MMMEWEVVVWSWGQGWCRVMLGGGGTSDWTDERRHVVRTYETFSCRPHLRCGPASPSSRPVSESRGGHCPAGFHGPGRTRGEHINIMQLTVYLWLKLVYHYSAAHSSRDVFTYCRSGGLTRKPNVIFNIEPHATKIFWPIFGFYKQYLVFWLNGCNQQPVNIILLSRTKNSKTKLPQNFFKLHFWPPPTLLCGKLWFYMNLFLFNWKQEPLVVEQHWWVQQ